MENIDIIKLKDFLPGFVQNDRFYSLVDWHVNDYHSKNSFFSILVMDFEIIPEKKYVINEESVLKFFTTAINTTITRHTDSYTIDDNKIVILLANRTAQFAKAVLNKILGYIAQKYSDSIIITAGISECPDDAVNLKGLQEIAVSRLAIVSSPENQIEKVLYHEEINRSLNNIENTLKSSLFKQLGSLVEIINQYDPYLGEHSALVTQGCILLAKEINLSWKEIEKLSISALLHDIGYTAIPKEIYHKKGGLSPEEWKVIKLHPAIACEHILKAMPMFDEYIPLILNHHEHLDGSGYPFGKKGDQIPLGAQIISIVDTYHAMKTDRPYRKAMPFEEIVDYYIKNAGIKWHEELITMFAAILADNELSEKLDKKEEFSMSLLMESD